MEQASGDMSLGAGGVSYSLYVRSGGIEWVLDQSLQWQLGFRKEAHGGEGWGYITQEAPIAGSESESHSGCRTRMVTWGWSLIGEVLSQFAGSLGFDLRPCINVAWVAHICNPSTAEVKVGGSEFQVRSRLAWPT